MRREQRNGRSSTREAEDVPSELRSRIMRAVRRERTTPELAVARYLRARGVRFRTNVRSLPGSPDLANKTRKLAVYVHGCFWHRHPGCKKATTPKDNADFWRTKFEQNVARDRRKEEALRELGFEVAVVWECESGDEKRLDRALRKVLRRATDTSLDERIRGRRQAGRKE